MAYFGYDAPATGTYAEQLALWQACLAAISVVGQEYTIRDRTYTHADLKDVRETIDWLEEKVSAETTGQRSAVNYAVRGRAI